MSTPAARGTVEAIRRVLLLALLVSLLGMVIELFLLEHTEDPWQWVPIVIGTSSLIVLGWYAVARLEQYTFIPIDLNTAPDSAILSIPGAGPRVLREFEKYRPYRSIEKFRREMGKYWNKREVARLERYVTIKQ